MKIRWVKFVVTSLLVFSFGTTFCLGQGFDAGAGAEDGAQPDAGDFDGFFGDDQTRSAEEEELLQGEVDRLNQEAAAKAEQGDINGALTSYEEAIRANPNFKSYLERARLLIQQEETQDAIISYGRAAQFAGTVEDDSEVLPTFLELGQAYLDAEQFNLALQAFGAALQLPKQSRNAEVLYNIGLAQTEYALNQQYSTAQTRQEELTQALSYFDKALRIAPNYADALYERGNTHVMLGDADKAIEDLERAVENDPDNTDAVAQLGFVSLQRGLGEAAQREGQTAKILRDLELAERTLTQYLEMVPEDQEVDEEDEEAIRRENVLLNRSAAYIGLGDENPDNSTFYYRKAITDSETAIGIDPKKSDAYYQKGMAHRMLGESDDALSAYTEAIELSQASPSLPEYLLRRAITFFRLGDYDLAKADLEQSIRFSGGFNARGYFWLGLCYQKEGKTNRAVSEYTRAIRYQPTYSLAYMNRGLGYMKMGRFERATSDFNEVLRLDGSNSEARSLRDQAKQLDQDASLVR